MFAEQLGDLQETHSFPSLLLNRFGFIAEKYDIDHIIRWIILL